MIEINLDGVSTQSKLILLEGKRKDAAFKPARIVQSYETVPGFNPMKEKFISVVSTSGISSDAGITAYTPPLPPESAKYSGGSILKPVPIMLGNRFYTMFPRFLADDSAMRKRYFKTIGSETFRKFLQERGFLKGEEITDEQVELLGEQATIRALSQSPDVESDLIILGELTRRIENFYGDLFGNEELLGQRVHLLRPALSNLFVNETGILEGYEIDGMSDDMLGSIFSKIGKFFKGVGRGIGKVAKGVWKGVKGAGKFVRKVGTGLWKGVKAAGKWAGKTIGKIAKGIGKGVVGVAKFIGKNALPLLQAGLSFIPGGSLISTGIDLLKNVLPGQQEQAPVVTPYSPPPPVEMSTVTPYSPPETVVVQPESIMSPQDYTELSPEEIAQYQQEYYDANTDPYQEEMTEGDLLLGKSFFRKLGEGITNLAKKIIDPRFQLSAANVLQQAAKQQIQAKQFFKQLPNISRRQEEEYETESGVQIGVESFWETYKYPLMIGAGILVVALIAMQNKK